MNYGGFLRRQTRFYFIFNNRQYKSTSRQIGERFLTTFAKLKVVSPTAMAKLAIDSASLESPVINREIFIPNREIGTFSLLDVYIKNREISRQIGRLGSSDNVLRMQKLSQM